MASQSPSIDRTVPPSGGPIRPFHLPRVERAGLKSGLGVLSMSRGDVPLVSVCLVLDAGEGTVPAEKGGLSVLTGDALQGGTERRSAEALAEALEGAGTGLRVSTGWDGTTVAFTCLAERVDEVLSLLSEVVRSPSFPQQEVDRVRRERLSSIRQRRMDPSSLADDELDRRVFEKAHPYHRPLAGDELSVSPMDRADMVALAATYRPADAGLVLVGDLSPDHALALAERHLGDWQSVGATTPPVPPQEELSSRSIVVVHRSGAVQSELRIGHPGPARGDPDEIPLRVSNLVLGGAFTSRLNLCLREKHGFTYGARSSPTFRRNGGVFTIRTAVQTEVTAAALKETLLTFEAFAETGPTSEELARARDYIAGVFPLRMETTSQLAARLAELIIYRLPDDYHHTYRERIRAVEDDQAQGSVRRNLHPSRSVVLVVGDADRIVPEIEALDVGPVEVADPWT